MWPPASGGRGAAGSRDERALLSRSAPGHTGPVSAGSARCGRLRAGAEARRVARRTGAAEQVGPGPHGPCQGMVYRQPCQRHPQTGQPCSSGAGVSAHAGTCAAGVRAGSAIRHARALASRACFTHAHCASAMRRARAGTRLEQEARAQQGLLLIIHVAKHGVEERRIEGALPRASAHAEPAWQRAQLHLRRRRDTAAHARSRGGAPHGVRKPKQTEATAGLAHDSEPVHEEPLRRTAPGCPLAPPGTPMPAAGRAHAAARASDAARTGVRACTSAALP